MSTENPSTYAFDGEFLPSRRRMGGGNDTFSLGVYPQVPRANGKGIKRGRVLVRIVARADAEGERLAVAKANEVIAQLTAGTYSGPKSVRV